MKATQLLHDEGQSLWLDNITRDLLDSGTLKRYIDELSITGLTSNPTIFDHAIKNSATYDSAITTKLKKGTSVEVPQISFDQFMTRQTGSMGGSRWKCPRCLPMTRSDSSKSASLDQSARLKAVG